MKVAQTIRADDPERLGNCVSACVATFLDIPLAQVPHFLEQGEFVHKEALGRQGLDPEIPDVSCWWAWWCGFMAGHRLGPVRLENVTDAEPGEIVFVSGPTNRTALHHQVLYRDGELWHDPHPSRVGVLEITEVLAWRPIAGYDHAPTPSDPP